MATQAELPLTSAPIEVMTVQAECGCTLDEDSACSNCCSCRSCCGCAFCSACDNSVDKVCTRCDDCEDCCSCFTCGSCGVKRDEDTECSNCSNSAFCCCGCAYCGGCDNRVDSVCENCDRCPNCCEGCGDPVPFRARNLRFFEASPTQLTKNPLRRMVSVEIEVDHIDGDSVHKINAAIDKWNDSVVEDGSLSGEGSHEVNTQPSSGDLLIEHLSDLCEGYSYADADCSHDCGLHVHIDCAPCRNKGTRSKTHNPDSCPRCRYQLTYYDLRKVIALYAKTERAVFELVDNRRLNGEYGGICGQRWVCNSIERKAFRRELLGKMYNHGDGDDDTVAGSPLPHKGNRDVPERRKDKYLGVRYRALNLHSFFLRGTVEFRHHEGTVDVREMTSWALFCGWFIQRCAELSESQINALPDGREGLLAIMPDSLHAWMNEKWAEHYTDRDKLRADRVWRAVGTQTGMEED